MLPAEVARDADTVSVLGEPDDGDEEAAEPEDLFEFSLESHLRDFIAPNIGTLNLHGSRLKLFRDSAGRTGIEFPTDVSPIHILAVDEGGNLFVFELKLSRGADKAMSQLLRYMG